MPMDAMPKYVENTWDTIRNEKELNLPDQMEMVAIFRCNEFKTEAISSV